MEGEWLCTTNGNNPFIQTMNLNKKQPNNNKRKKEKEKKKKRKQEKGESVARDFAPSPSPRMDEV